MTPERAFELLTKLAVPVIAAGGVLTLLWLGVLASADGASGHQMCSVSTDCDHRSASLSAAGVLPLPALLLALAALPLVKTRRYGRLRPAATAWGTPAWWRFGVAAYLLVTAAVLEYAGLRFLTSLDG